MKNRLTVFGTIEFSRSKFAGSKYSPRYIGGNGILASLAASKHTPVNLIGVIGSDLGIAKLSSTLGKKINVSNVTELKGKTFDYKAIYDPTTFELIDEKVKFGVYAKYRPKILDEFIDSTKYLLFSGSNPRFGLEIIRQLKNPEIVGVNTLYYHLVHNFEYAIQLIEFATYLFTSEREYELIAAKTSSNLFSRFKNLKYIFKTKGKNGVEVITKSGTKNFQPLKKIEPLDPTNAGDVFVGTIMGLIIKGISLDKDLKKIVQVAQSESLKVITNDKFYRKSLGNKSIEKTNTFLDKIIANKILEVENLKKLRPLKSLKNSLLERETKIRNFSKAISRKNRLSLIAEIKKASPSAGLIRPNFDHVLIAKEYEESGLVDAISVLTEKKYFQGDIKFIKDIKKVTSVPILRKDFIFDEFQIYEAYLAGADALLLIAAVLEQSELNNLLGLTDKLGMDALVEVHSEKEIETVLKAGTRIIGINARDLKTFRVDSSLFRRLSKYIPREVIKVAESGLEQRKDLEKAHKAGANAVLVGTSILEAKNIKLKLGELVS